jgi:hypothetical protein
MQNVATWPFNAASDLWMQPKARAGASTTPVQRPGELSRPTDRAAVPQVQSTVVTSGRTSASIELSAIAPLVVVCWAQHMQTTWRFCSPGYADGGVRAA